MNNSCTGLLWLNVQDAEFSTIFAIGHGLVAKIDFILDHAHFNTSGCQQFCYPGLWILVRAVYTRLIAL